MIETAETAKVRTRQQDGTVAELTVKEWWATHTKEQKTTSALTAKAYISEGRWVVDCPCSLSDGTPCNSAQLASKSDRRFYCTECGNSEVKGQWIPVEWPAEEGEIEAEMMKRPRVENQNWRPGETLASLQRERLDAMSNQLADLDDEALDELAAKVNERLKNRKGGVR